jgi:hypothetical protein
MLSFSNTISIILSAELGSSSKLLLLETLGIAAISSEIIFVEMLLGKQIRSDCAWTQDFSSEQKKERTELVLFEMRVSAASDKGRKRSKEEDLKVLYESKEKLIFQQLVAGESKRHG